LVTDRNFTLWPSAANFAAVPAEPMSQSSGCAPMAITRIGVWANAAAAVASRIKNLDMGVFIIAFFLLSDASGRKPAIRSVNETCVYF
jgi:hypothetical protein